MKDPTMNNRQPYTRLALFDIDGTLLDHSAALKYEMTTGTTSNRYYQAIKKELGVTVSTDFLRFSGTTDRHILWTSSAEQGVTRARFEEKFEAIRHDLYEYFCQQVATDDSYRPISDSVRMVKALAARGDTCLGVITGNIDLIGKWKLERSGLASVFSLGLFGNESEDRGKLAGKAFERAKETCGVEFTPAQVTVIGDTVRDVQCGKAIGAYTIAVNMGGEDALDQLRAENPDMAVPTLADEKVYAHFGI
jgi:phosphoglycolate phosphatase-like HAD superfamily hydrolase